MLARCGYLGTVLRRGELATPDGCCLGVIEMTGTRAELTWRDAEAGVLCLSQDATAVSATGRDLVLAAIQHRKAVIAIDLFGDSRSSQHGLAVQIGPACAEVTAPLRRFSWQIGSFDPIAEADPVKAASLVLAMIDWTGAGQARRLLCTSYLEAALRVIAVAGPASSRSGRTSNHRSGPLLDELISLLAPGALPARLAELRGPPPARGELAAKVAELTGQLGGDYSVLAPVAGQLAELARALTLCWPGGTTPRNPPPSGQNSPQEPITIARALTGREVAYFPLDRPVRGRPAEMVARLVIASVADALAERSDLGIGCDALVWIDGCESVEARQLAVLTSLGARTGTAVVLGTTVASTAVALAPDVNVIAVRGSAPPGLGAQLPDDRLPPGDGPDRLSWSLRNPAAGPAERLVAGCRVVR